MSMSTVSVSSRSSCTICDENIAAVVEQNAAPSIRNEAEHFKYFKVSRGGRAGALWSLCNSKLYGIVIKTFYSRLEVGKSVGVDLFHTIFFSIASNF